jgi:hypothetical protein
MSVHIFLLRDDRDNQSIATEPFEILFRDHWRVKSKITYRVPYRTVQYRQIRDITQKTEE